VNTKVKYLDFRGIEKKEQILFKSFLNLAKNELDYQVIVVNAASAGEISPDILIVDSSYEFSESEQDLTTLPAIFVGSEVDVDSDNYISRPVQWSDFKAQLSLLTFDDQVIDSSEAKDRLLPDQMKFVIAEMDEKPSISEIEESDSEEFEDYDYELGSMSIDYQSVTNSDYVKVVDDVKGFQDPEEVSDLGEASQAVILVTNEESTSANSVLVIETDSMEAWDMDDLDDDQEQATSMYSEESSQDDLDEIERRQQAEIIEKLKSGKVVNKGEVYWESNAQIFSETDALLYIQADKNCVYSAQEPAKWGNALRNRQITKLPLEPGWIPTEGLKAYPISRLIWANIMATQNTALAEGIDANQPYMLERWPHFDLLELDNMLLKLCTMMFIAPESPYNLMQKTGYSRTVIYGLVNACHEAGLLTTEEQLVTAGMLRNTPADEGMLGKIKDVFR